MNNFRTFANEDEEPTALAIDNGKSIPILSGETARIFLERAEKAELEAERKSKIPPTLEELKREYSYNKMFLEFERRNLEEKEKQLEKLEAKIREIEFNNGKTEEG